MKQLKHYNIEKLQKEYENGVSNMQIALHNGITDVWVAQLAKKFGWFRLSPMRKKRRDRITWKALDQNAFETITPESAYWIGFIMADGSVSHKNQWSQTLQVNLKDSDINQLEKLKLFLKSEHKIGVHISQGFAKGRTKFCHFAVSSNKIVQDLNKYGVVPRKTQKEKVIGLEFNKDFWRGVIDGDGSIGTRYYKGDKLGKSEPSISLVGSFDLCSQFKAFVEYIVPGFKGSVGYGKSVHFIRVCARQAYKIIEYLYKDAEVYLDRKNERAQAIINNPEFQRRYDRPRIIEALINTVADGIISEKRELYQMLKTFYFPQLEIDSFNCQLYRAVKREELAWGDDRHKTVILPIKPL